MLPVLCAAGGRYGCSARDR